MEDTFNYSGFKAIFNLDELETVRSNSISEKFYMINQNSGKKFILPFAGVLPTGLEIFNTQRYSAVDNALAEAVLKQVEKDA